MPPEELRSGCGNMENRGAEGAGYLEAVGGGDRGMGLMEGGAGRGGCGSWVGVEPRYLGEGGMLG